MHTPNIYLATIYSEQVKHVRYHQEPEQSHMNVWVRMYHITLYKSPRMYKSPIADGLMCSVHKWSYGNTE